VSFYESEQLLFEKMAYGMPSVVLHGDGTTAEGTMFTFITGLQLHVITFTQRLVRAVTQEVKEISDAYREFKQVHPRFALGVTMGMTADTYVAKCLLYDLRFVFENVPVLPVTVVLHSDHGWGALTRATRDGFERIDKQTQRITVIPYDVFMLGFIAYHQKSGRLPSVHQKHTVYLPQYYQLFPECATEKQQVTEKTTVLTLGHYTVRYPIPMEHQGTGHTFACVRSNEPVTVMFYEKEVLLFEKQTRGEPSVILRGDGTTREGTMFTLVVDAELIVFTFSNRLVRKVPQHMVHGCYRALKQVHDRYALGWTVGVDFAKELRTSSCVLYDLQTLFDAHLLPRPVVVPLSHFARATREGMEIIDSTTKTVLKVIPYHVFIKGYHIMNRQQYFPTYRETEPL
jgi:hypothetical protein